MRQRPSEATSRGLGHQIGAGRVGAAHDGGEPLERRGREAELLDHSVEGAPLSAVAPEHVSALDVERGCAELLRDGGNLGRSDEQKDGVRIDEAADQPGAGDPVNLGTSPRYPQGAALGITRWQLGFRHHRQAGLCPRQGSAVKGVGGDALMAKPSGHALADLELNRAGILGGSNS